MLLSASCSEVNYHAIYDRAMPGALWNMNFQTGLPIISSFQCVLQTLSSIDAGMYDLDRETTICQKFACSLLDLTALSKSAYAKGSSRDCFNDPGCVQALTRTCCKTSGDASQSYICMLCDSRPGRLTAKLDKLESKPAKAPRQTFVLSPSSYLISQLLVCTCPHQTKSVTECAT